MDIVHGDELHARIGQVTVNDLKPLDTLRVTAFELAQVVAVDVDGHRAFHGRGGEVPEAVASGGAEDGDGAGLEIRQRVGELAVEQLRLADMRHVAFVVGQGHVEPGVGHDYRSMSRTRMSWRPI